MKNKDFEEKIKPVLKQAELDGDHYMIVHFSKVDDHFVGNHRMDRSDALIVICEMIKNFGLDPEVISQMNVNL